MSPTTPSRGPKLRASRKGDPVSARVRSSAPWSLQPRSHTPVRRSTMRSGQQPSRPPGSPSPLGHSWEGGSEAAWVTGPLRRRRPAPRGTGVVVADHERRAPRKGNGPFGHHRRLDRRRLHGIRGRGRCRRSRIRRGRSGSRRRRGRWSADRRRSWSPHRIPRTAVAHGLHSATPIVTPEPSAFGSQVVAAPLAASSAAIRLRT